MIQNCRFIKITADESEDESKQQKNNDMEDVTNTF